MARFDKNLGKDKYEVVSPCPPGPAASAVSLAEGENVYLMAGSANPAGQTKFAEFAVSAEGQTIGMAGDTDGNVVRLPVNSKVDMASVRKDTRWKLFAGHLQRRRPLRAGGAGLDAVPPGVRRHAQRDGRRLLPNVKTALDKLAASFAQELQKQGKASMTPVAPAAPGAAPPAGPARPGAPPRVRAAVARQASPWAVPGAGLAAVRCLQVRPDGPRGPDELQRGAAYLGDRWVGLDNYRESSTDDAFALRRGHTRRAGARRRPPARSSSVCVLALLLEGPARHLWFIRTAVFLPAVTAMAVVAELWRIIYYPAADGALNTVLGLVGLGPAQFLDSPTRRCCRSWRVGIWRGAPYDMMIFLAGLAGVDRTLYEAAAVDGASTLRRLWHVTLPALRPVFAILFTLAAIRGLRVLHRGLPADQRRAERLLRSADDADLQARAGTQRARRRLGRRRAAAVRRDPRPDLLASHAEGQSA